MKYSSKYVFLFIFILVSIYSCKDEESSNEPVNARCGNSIIETGEECDKNNLGDLSCLKLGYTDGLLTCNNECKRDLTNCSTCGNNLAELNEDCDGDDFKNNICNDYLFTSGKLICEDDCTVNTSLCTKCGNNLAENIEECDGDDFKNITCEDLHFAGGNLSCSENCSILTESCFYCGNGIWETSEECDEIDFNGQTCNSFDFYNGNLLCTDDCKIIKSECNNCGNNIIDTNESCDGNDLNEQTCKKLGFESEIEQSLLKCNPDCTFNTSDCIKCEDSCIENESDCMNEITSENENNLCDGMDNDCDGIIDEGCVCIMGQVQPCFLNSPNKRNIGACKDGIQICENKSWGECTGSIEPTDDWCDDLDNDCDGCIDDGLCCTPNIDCGFEIGDVVPFRDKTIEGSLIYSGSDVTLWKWSLSKGPCDIVLNKTSFTMNGQSVTEIEGALLSQLNLNFQLSGNYTLTVIIHTESNGIMECSWIIKVMGPGLRVELCWDTTGETDLDLHLGKLQQTSDWFDKIGSDADCYFFTCRPNYNYFVNWGYATIDGKFNPRLDIDNRDTVGIPENINLDNPNPLDEFRVFVHYFKGNLVTRPIINIYCGGALKATYGITPQLQNFDYGCEDDCGDGWKVVDIKWQGTPFDNTCELSPVLQNDVYLIETGPFTWP